MAAILLANFGIEGINVRKAKATLLLMFVNLWVITIDDSCSFVEPGSATYFLGNLNYLNVAIQ